MSDEVMLMFRFYNDALNAACGTPGEWRASVLEVGIQTTFTIDLVDPHLVDHVDHVDRVDQDLDDQVDGGGVQAEVVETDVGASNGVIHSINRVRPSPPCSSFLQNCERLNVVLLNPPPHCKTEFCMHRIPLSTILCNYQLIVINISFEYERFVGSAV